MGFHNYAHVSTGFVITVAELRKLFGDPEASADDLESKLTNFFYRHELRLVASLLVAPEDDYKARDDPNISIQMPAPTNLSSFFGGRDGGSATASCDLDSVTVSEEAREEMQRFCELAGLDPKDFPPQLFLYHSAG